MTKKHRAVETAAIVELPASAVAEIGRVESVNDLGAKTKADTFREMLALLSRLDEAKISHRLQRVRDDALMIEVHVPGERWEIEFVDYGDEVHVEIERFRSNGKMYDEKMLERLFAWYSADSPEVTPEEVCQENEAFFRS